MTEDLTDHRALLDGPMLGCALDPVNKCDLPLAAAHREYELTESRTRDQLLGKLSNLLQIFFRKTLNRRVRWLLRLDFELVLHRPIETAAIIRHHLRNNGDYNQFMLLATWVAWRTVTFVLIKVQTN
jgi:hypothetical protein